MANKQYISPIRLYKHCAVELNPDINISRIKKHLNAEFAIATNGLIEIDGFSYNKHDLFEELEHSDFEKRLNYHQRIWDSKNVLSFLENNEFAYLSFKDELKQFHNDDEFDLFFSTYFAASFSVVLRNKLNELPLASVGNLLLFEPFILSDEREEAFKPLRIFFEENLRLLKNTNKDSYKLMHPKITHWVDYEWSSFINNLPEEFYEEKQEIAFKLTNILAAIQKTNRDDCRKLSYELSSITGLEKELADVIYKNHQIITGHSSSKSGGNNWSWIIWVILILIRILVHC